MVHYEPRFVLDLHNYAIRDIWPFFSTNILTPGAGISISVRHGFSYVGIARHIRDKSVFVIFVCCVLAAKSKREFSFNQFS